MKFVLVNGRTPRPQSFCAFCCDLIGKSYLRELTTRLSYCELAAIHSITSSAATSNLSGTVRPSILAVEALMTSSNFVRLLDWQIRRLRALEDTPGVDANAAPRISHARAVVH
jgi:hypothetical protein